MTSAPSIATRVKSCGQRKLGLGIIGNPITYTVKGKQYVSVLSGIGGWIGLPVTAGLDLNDKFGAIGATAMTKAAGLGANPAGRNALDLPRLPVKAVRHDSNGARVFDPGAIFILGAPMPAVRESPREFELLVGGRPPFIVGSFVPNHSAKATDGAGDVKILIVDDHLAVREGVRCLFAAMRGTEIFDVASAQEALSVYRTKVPDVLLMDINLPDSSGFELLQEASLFEDKLAKIVVFSMHIEPIYVSRTFTAGSTGLRQQGCFDQRNHRRCAGGGGGWPLYRARDRDPNGSLPIRRREPAGETHSA